MRNTDVRMQQDAPRPTATLHVHVHAVHVYDDVRTCTVLANEIANFRYFTRSYGVCWLIFVTLARSKGIFTCYLPMK